MVPYTHQVMPMIVHQPKMALMADEEAEAGAEVGAEQQVDGAHQHDDADEHGEEPADLRVPGDAGEEVDSITPRPPRRPSRRRGGLGGRWSGASSPREVGAALGDRRASPPRLASYLATEQTISVGEHAVAGHVVVEVVVVVGVVAEAGHAAAALAALAVEHPVLGALGEELDELLDGEELAGDDAAGEREAEGAGAVGEARCSR